MSCSRAMDSAGWPIDLPRGRVDLEVGRRRHRRLTGPSGLLLFVCLFLPAVKQCGTAVYPVEMPYVWHPYVYGLALAVATLGITSRWIRVSATMLRVLAYLTLAGGGVLLAASTGFAGAWLALGLVLLATIGLRGHSERRIAATGIVISVSSLLWFGLWAGTASALVGVYVALAASIFLLAGSLLWLSEI